MISDDDDALSAALANMSLTEAGFWPAWITEVKGNSEEIIANLDLCSLSRECNAFLPFPLPRTKNNNVEQLLTSKAYNAVAQVPFFAVFPMPTPILLCMLTGMPSRQPLHDCDAGIKLLQQKYNDDLAEYISAQRRSDDVTELYPELLRQYKREFYHLQSSRTIIDSIQRLQLRRLNYERTIYSPHAHSWPKHVSTFTAFNVYYTVISTMISLPASDPALKKHQERLNACYNTFDEQLVALTAKMLSVNAVQGAVAVGVKQLNERMEVFNVLVPTCMTQAIVDYTYSILALAEKCVLHMLDVAMPLHEKLLCTQQRRIPTELMKEREFITDALLEEQAMLVRIRQDYHPHLWTSDALMRTRSESTPHLHTFHQYHEWVINACVRMYMPLAKHGTRAAYLQRVLKRETTSADGDWYTAHTTYDENTRIPFAIVN